VAGDQRRVDHGRFGAALTLAIAFASTGDFTNDGPVVNNGSITATNDGGTTTGRRSGARLSGNAVVLESGDVVADSAGWGSFLLNYESGTLTGTIPAGQTVTVEGEPFNDLGRLGPEQRQARRGGSGPLVGRSLPGGLDQHPLRHGGGHGRFARSGRCNWHGGDQ
jgi:hypothetical protein